MSNPSIVNLTLQELEGKGGRSKHEAAVIQFEELELEGYGPFRSAAATHTTCLIGSCSYNVVNISAS